MGSSGAEPGSARDSNSHVQIALSSGCSLPVKETDRQGAHARRVVCMPVAADLGSQLELSADAGTREAAQSLLPYMAKNNCGSTQIPPSSAVPATGADGVGKEEPACCQSFSPWCEAGPALGPPLLLLSISWELDSFSWEL